MMARAIVIGVLLTMAATGAGLIAFEISLERSDDFDKQFFDRLDGYENQIHDQTIRPPKGAWMPLFRAGSIVRVRDVMADPADETFELSFSVFAQEDSILFACLGKEKKLCFGVGHGDEKGWRRIGWYDRPGGKQLIAWDEAADDYYSFAVHLRQDGGELVAEVNDQRVGSLPADYIAGPIAFFVGNRDTRLDEVVVVAHAEHFAQQVPAGYWPYLYYFFAALLMIIVFLLDRALWRQLGVEAPGVWVALGYSSLLIIYWAGDHPFRTFPVAAVVAVVYALRCLSLPLFPEFLGEDPIDGRRWQKRWWPEGPLEWAVFAGVAAFCLPMLGFGIMHFNPQFRGPITASARDIILLSSIIGLLFGLAPLFLPALLVFLTGVRARLARRFVYFSLLVVPVRFFVPIYFFNKLDSGIEINLHFTLVMLPLAGFLVAVARHKRTTLRWAIIASLLLLVVFESDNPFSLRNLDFRQVQGDRFYWEAPPNPAYVIEGWAKQKIVTLGKPENRQHIKIGYPYNLTTALGLEKNDVMDQPVFRQANSFQFLVELQEGVLPDYKMDFVVCYFGQFEDQGAHARTYWERFKAADLPSAPTYAAFMRLKLVRFSFDGPDWLWPVIDYSALARWRWLRQLDIEYEAYREAQDKLPPEKQDQNQVTPTNREVLEQIAKLGREHDFTPIFMPACDMAGRFVNAYHAGLMREVAAEYEIPFIDLRETIREYETPYLDPLMLSQAAHEKMAEAVAAVINPPMLYSGP